MGGDCGGSDWCKKGLYCNEDLGMFSDNACELCPCNPGVARGLRSDGDGQPALPCGALNLLGDECGDEHGGCAPGMYCDDSGWFSSFECIMVMEMKAAVMAGAGCSGGCLSAV